MRKSDQIRASTLMLAQEVSLTMQPEAGSSSSVLLSRVIEVVCERAEEAAARASSARSRLQVAQALTQHHSLHQPLTRTKDGFAADATSPTVMHQCFRFRPKPFSKRLIKLSSLSEEIPQRDDGLIMNGLIKALAAIAGSSLGVILCDSRAASARILEAGGALGHGDMGQLATSGAKLRIWPLDSITTGPDRRIKQQAAVAAIGLGESSFAV